ncbi:NAD-dependent epimerase/dehydratase family protein [Paraburkholderia graminis]|uniref:NAD-dependent epimerase/dehydratase family protein n=1 Tax=Paraburkholderia graminis TaxID=60548 RepID=UPI0038BD3D5A
MIHLVTGAAGFIGSHLVAALLARGDVVIACDNLSRGKQAYLDAGIASGRCQFVEADCADLPAFRERVAAALEGRALNAIWHMAANSDIPAGVADPRIDLRDTFMTTFNSLLLMRELGAKTFHFASSSAVYGDFGDEEISEKSAPLKPISNYGAMKLASEAQITAALESHGEHASIFRFPNVVGAPATHGVIFDFIHKLRANPARLDVLGDGTQQKAYLHVSDLVEAMQFIAAQRAEKVSIVNIGPSDAGVTVKSIAEGVRDAVAPAAQIAYGQGNKGWVGDVPRFRYATTRLAQMGWEPRLNSAQAVQQAITDIAGTL